MDERDLYLLLERYPWAPRHVRLEIAWLSSNELIRLLMSFVLLVYMEVEKIA